MRYKGLLCRRLVKAGAISAFALMLGNEGFAAADAQTIKNDPQPPSAALAQLSNQADSGGVSQSQSDAAALEVVVTAERRQQRLFDVPVSITAISADTIDKYSITSLKDLSALAPNLQVSMFPTSDHSMAIAMRGFRNSGLNAAVGVYIDGIPIGSGAEAGGILDMVNLERIEVLRGPQGTLWGRDTLAGAVNYVTHRPSGEFAGKAAFYGGNYNFYKGVLTADLPKFGPFRASVALVTDRRDGWQKVIGPQNSDMGNRHTDSVRAQVAADISDSFTASYVFDSTEAKAHGTPSQLYSTNPAYWAFIPIPGYTTVPDYASTERLKEVYLDSPQTSAMKTYGHSITLGWDISSNLALTSVTSYRSNKSSRLTDLDSTPLPVYTNYVDMSDRQWWQELRLNGDSGRLNYVVGAAYYDLTQRGSLIDYTRFGGMQHQQIRAPSGGHSTSYAIFGQVDYDLTPKLKLSIGGRYNDDEATGGDTTITNVLTSGSFTLPHFKTTSTQFSPMANVSYKLAENINAYVRYAEGYNAGYVNATNALSGVTPLIKPVTVESIEFGAKMRFLDRRLQVNTAFFQNEEKNLQASVYLSGSGTPIAINSGTQRQRGFEVETAFMPSEWLTLQLNYGYVDSKYLDYRDAAGNDVSNNRAVVFAPKDNLSASADVRLYKGNLGTIRAFASYTYTNSYYVYPYQLASSGPMFDPTLQVAGTTEISSRDLVNARLSFTDFPFDKTGGLQIDIWGNNLTDVKSPASYIDFGPALGSLLTSFYSDPRTYGATISYKW